MVTITLYATAKSLQSCPTLCHPIDGSPLGWGDGMGGWDDMGEWH